MSTAIVPAQEQVHARETDAEFQTGPQSQEELICQRAHEIWLERGDEAGSAVQNWLEAEAEILGGVER